MRADVYPMWNDVQTYLTISLEAEEKSSLLLAISHFKNKNKDTINIDI